MSDPYQVPGQAPGLTGIYTETLARLYAKQGLYNQALAIYRHLSQIQPENQEWPRKIAALEQQRMTAGTMLEAVEETITPVQRGSPLAAQRRSHQVMAHLERWLAHLQRQHRS